jgi:hypothetical protein
MKRRSVCIGYVGSLRRISSQSIGSLITEPTKGRSHQRQARKRLHRLGLNPVARAKFSFGSLIARSASSGVGKVTYLNLHTCSMGGDGKSGSSGSKGWLDKTQGRVVLYPRESILHGSIQ